MKRTIVFSLVFLMVFTIGLSAKVKVNLGTYSTLAADFSTKFWKEMFKGGFPGQPGNVLQALGDGYIFNQAKLVTVEPGAWGGLLDDPITYAYKSTYTGGKMTLNPSGPWCDSGTLKAKNVTAINYSNQDPVLIGILYFHLTITGDFSNAPYSFVIDALYSGQPEIKYDETTGLPIFQRGMDYDVTITISPITIGGDAGKPKKLG